ncbi:NADH-quinone oxidoreductase subunit N [Geoalkalibacter halelectricus]|uniref:NADH-quinone oxidoreductase subunit N n=1 Tax=Geoalkalibacter halelectricus TaxID=2847045 RepID=A0ABY5ZLJ7_9BACT|nr:NADH-quinone oxidoreductase subunit N [Geoalkalibacter halelectricus]MDO3378646.1 NADH-quinone oxidoreductase subunit N [Geoalkalibacter halelectricus]UWZ80042.1 NADH-quinone oxidoreductase subunit N [Geoalkalibacter halelectricus]
MKTMLFLPELLLITLALLCFFASLGRPRAGFLQAMVMVFATLALIASAATFNQAGLLFYDAYQVDSLSQLFKMILCAGLVLVAWAGPGLRGIEQRLRPEYYFFVTLSTLGLVFLASAVELVTIFLALEISSFALFVAIPFRQPQNSREQFEAGIKYVLFGAAASGLTLFGMSYIFGLSGTTHLAQLAPVLPELVASQPLAVLGMVLLLSGFFYKLALFPMHFWTPDVYQGAANETAGFVATLPKLGAVILLLRLVSLAGVDMTQLTWALGILAVVSMTVGNFAALVQNDIKRLLAYSSVAHAGYLMLGILAGNPLGQAGAIYYALGYLLMNLACFFVLYHLSSDSRNLSLDDLKGLYRRSPLLAFTLAAGAFSLAGIPPTIGFTGKFVVFTAAFQQGFHGLVVLGLINAAISIFFYLKMVRAAYLSTEDGGEAVPLGVGTRMLGYVLILAIILLGVLPQGFLALAKTAVAQLPL